VKHKSEDVMFNWIGNLMLMVIKDGSSLFNLSKRLILNVAIFLSLGDNMTSEKRLPFKIFIIRCD